MHFIRQEVQLLTDLESEIFVIHSTTMTVTNKVEPRGRVYPGTRVNESGPDPGHKVRVPGPQKYLFVKANT